MAITIFPYLTRRQSKLDLVTESEFESVSLYKWRMEELTSTREKDRIFPAATITYFTDGSMSHENNVPDVDYVIALATRFRLFFGEKEPCRFETVANILLRRSADVIAKGYIAHLKLLYASSMSSHGSSEAIGANITNKLMINLWFNSQFFHSDTKKREQLLDIHKNIGRHGSLFHLYTAIRRCIVELERLYVVLHKFDRQHPYIYTPEHDFLRR